MGCVSRIRKGMNNSKQPSSQINAGALQKGSGGGQGGGGPDNYDGRAKTQAGDTQGQSWERPSFYDDGGKVIQSE